jgi:hypothetical protein
LHPAVYAFRIDLQQRHKVSQFLNVR